MTNPKTIAGSRKPQLQLVPPVANILESQVLAKGLDKYGEANWRTGPGIEHKQYIGAALRHLAAIADREDLDPETKCLHWAHVRATAGIVLDAMSLGKLIDDRPPAGKAAEYIRKLTNAKK